MMKIRIEIPEGKKVAPDVLNAIFLVAGAEVCTTDNDGENHVLVTFDNLSRTEVEQVANKKGMNIEFI
jgi:hypothetical protein